MEKAEEVHPAPKLVEIDKTRLIPTFFDDDWKDAFPVEHLERMPATPNGVSRDLLGIKR